MKIQSMIIIYEQDCDISPNDIQTLEVSTGDNGGGKYFVLKTERWAIDNVDELINLLKDFQNKL